MKVEATEAVSSKRTRKTAPSTALTTNASLTPAEEVFQPHPNSYRYVGLRSSKIFHKINCSRIDWSTSCDLIYFHEAAEAEIMTYAPCPVCLTCQASAGTTLPPANGAMPSQRTEDPSLQGIIFRDDMAREALALLNAKRAETGKAPLRMNASLENSAKIRAKELISVFGHGRPDGSSVYTAISLPYVCAAENIAAGPKTPQRVIKSWTDSACHNRNMLDLGDRGCTDIGFACLYAPNSLYKFYWVQIFARLR